MHSAVGIFAVHGGEDVKNDELTSCRAKEVTDIWGCDWISNIYPSAPMMKPLISRAAARAVSLQEMVVLICVSNKVPVFNPHWITSKSHARRYHTENPYSFSGISPYVMNDIVRGHCPRTMRTDSRVKDQEGTEIGGGDSESCL